MIKKIVSGFGANFFSQLSSVFLQIVSVPIIIKSIGISGYGDWVLVYTIPAYIAIMDFGIISVAANNVTILFARGDVENANLEFKRALSISITAFMSIFVVFLACALLTEYLFDIKNVGAVVFLVAAALLSLVFGFFDIVYRAVGLYHIGVYIISICRVGEMLFGLIVLVITKSIIFMAIGFFVARFLMFFLVLLKVKRKFNYFTWSFSIKSPAEVFFEIKRSAAFMAFPVGNALSLQTSAIIVGAFSGPVALASYSVCKTLSRTVVQFITMVSKSVWPEISRLYAAGDIEKIRKIAIYGSIVFGLICCVFALIVYSFRNLIINYWLPGESIINFDKMMGLLLLSAALTSFWQIAIVITMATNKFNKSSIIYLGASIFGILFAIYSYETFGVYSVVYSSIIFDAIMIIYSVCFIVGIRKNYA